MKLQTFNINYHFLCFAVIPRCRCVKTSKSVWITLIAQLKLDEPRPHCNRREVMYVHIVTGAHC